MAAQLAADGGLGDITSLINLVKNQNSTSSTSTNISTAGVTQQINDILQGNGGLATIGNAQKTAGFYNSSTNQQLQDDLLARASAQVAAKNATVTTSTSKKSPLNASTVETLLASAALKKAIGGKGIVQNTKDAYNSIADELGVGPNSGSAADAAVNGVSGAGPGAQVGDFTTLEDGIASNGGDLGLGALSTGTFADGSSADIGALTSADLTDGAGAAADAATFADGSSAGIGALTSAELTDGAGAGAADLGISSAADAGAGGASGISGAAAGGWGALAVAGAADATDTANSGDTAAEIGSVVGGLGTGDIIRGLDSGNVIDSVNPLGQGVASALGVPSTGGWIVCTELLRQGKFNRRHYAAGLKVFQTYPRNLLCGYYVWATPLVLYIRRNPSGWVTSICQHLFGKRAEFLAARAGVSGARDTVYGQSISALMYGFCFLLGKYLYRRELNSWKKALGEFYGRN